MPDVIVLVKTFVSWVGMQTAVALNIATGATMAIGAAVIVGGTLVVSKAMSLFEVEMPTVDTDASRQTTVKSTTAPQKIIYGEALVSGPISYIGLSGADNKDLYQTIVLAGHEVTDITDIHMDDVVISNSDIGLGVAAGGAVSSGSFEFGPKGSPSTTMCVINKYRGTTSQLADPLFTAAFSIGPAGSHYTSNHRGRGIAYLAMKWTLNEDTSESWEKYAPQNVKALVQGKAVYDPRTLTTVYSTNPALCVADYLTDTVLGMGIPTTKIDWPAVTIAANGCDVSVNVPGGTESRFTCNGVIFATDSHQKNINKILSSMNGNIVYSNGMYIIRAGIYEATSGALNEDDLIGAISIKTSAERSDRFNTIKGLFIDPSQNHKSSEFPKVQLANAVARDNNEVLEKEVQYPMTNSSFMAQRLSHKLILQSSQQKVVTFPANMSALRITAGDRVAVSIEELSWASKEFICVGWAFSEEGGVDLTLREDDLDAYADPTLVPLEYSTITASGDITDAFRGVPAPSGLGAISGEGKVFLDWVNPGKPNDYQTIDVYASPNNNFNNAETKKIGTTKANEFTHTNTNVADPIAVTDERFYWVRAVRNVGTDAASQSSLEPTVVSSVSATVVATEVDWSNVADPTIGIDITTDIISIDLGSASSTTGKDVAQSGISEDVTISSGGILMNQGGAIRGGQSAYNSGTGFFLGYDSSLYKFSIGNGSNQFLTFDGTNFAVGGSITATSGSIANSVTVGGTAASTVASGAAAGATSSQVNAGLALLLNKDTYGNANTGEASLVSVDKDGIPILETSSITSNGFIQWNGSKITVEAVQYTESSTVKFTVMTGLAGKRGFIVFDTTKSNPFTVSAGAMDVAFAYKEGAQWYYDNNGSAVTFTPNVSGSGDPDVEKYKDIVALGYLETGIADTILKGGLINPVTLTAAAFPSDEVKSGSIGGVLITPTTIESNFVTGVSGFQLKSDGTLEAGDGTFRGTVNATAGAFTGDVSTDSKFIAGANSSTVTLDGRASANYSIFAGDDEESNASFKVSSSGVVEATRLIIRDDANGQILIDTSNTSNPFSGVVYTSISQGSGAGVDTVSGHLDNDADEITITTTQAENFLITTRVAIDDNDAELNNIGGASTSSIADAISQLTSSQLRVEYYLQEDGGSYAEEDVETISFTTSTPSSSEIKVLGLDRGAGYGGSLTRYHAVVLGYGAAELATYYNTAAGANRARIYAVTTASISISQAGTHKIKVLAKLVLSGTSTVISTGTTPPLTNNQSIGVVLDPDQSPLNQSSLEDFRRLYEMTSANGFVASQTDDAFAIGEGTTILTSGGTISGDLVITGDLTVNGTTTSIHVADLTVADKDITLNYSTGDSSSTANNAGIIIQDAVDVSTDASILWKTATDRFEFSNAIQSGGNITQSSGNITAYGDVIIGFGGLKKGATTIIDAAYNATFTGITATGGTSTNWNTAYTYSQVGHLPLAGGTLTGAVSWPSGSSANANTAYTYSQVGHLPLAGGAMTGAITTNSTFDGVDIATRDGVLTSTTTTANAALPKAGGTMTGILAMGANAITSTGTISSGAITSTGLINAVGGVINTNTGSNPFYVTRSGATNQALKIHVDDAAVVFESIQDENVDNYGTFIFSMDGGTTEPFFDVRKGTASSGSKFRVDGSGALQVGSANTTFLDASRNLTNIGTISSGAITSTGNITASEKAIVSGNTNSYSTAPIVYFDSTSTASTAIRDWAIGPADDSYGNFHIFVGASTGADPVGNAGRVLTISNTGNATFAGTISSGAITSTGIITATSGTSTNWNTAYGWGDHASAGYLTSYIDTDTHTHLDTNDNRIISPSEFNAGDLYFGFTSWDNDNTDPYADFLHMRSYTDSSGGADNLVMFKKSGIGMRIWQQTYGSTTAYASYEDVWHTGTLTTTNKSNYDTAVTVSNAALPKAGGTMTGTLAMGANAITSTGTISSGAITATAGIYANSLKGLTSTAFTQGSPGDRLLGTFNCSQAGQTLKLVYYGGQGYNADNSQNGRVHVFIRSSNNSSNQAAQNSAAFYASGHWWAEGRGTIVSAVHVKQISNSSYQVIISGASYAGNGFVTVKVDSGSSWVPSMQDTTLSGTYLTLPQENRSLTEIYAPTVETLNGYKIGINTVIDASRNLTNIADITQNGLQTNAHSTPIKYTYNGNTGTYNSTVTYINLNNTSGSTNNGMFIEMGRLTDSGSAEVRHFVVGARGGQINFKVDGSGNTTATGTLSSGAISSGDITIAVDDTPSLNFKKASSTDVLASINVTTDTGTGGKLVIQTKRDGNTALDRLTINDDGHATFSGTISSGAITATGATFTGSVSSNNPITTTSHIEAQYFNSTGGQELILTGGESKDQLLGVTGGNPLQGENVYAVAEGGLQVISSPNNWIDGTDSYNDVTWASRNTAIINDSGGNSSFPGTISSGAITSTGITVNGDLVLGDDLNKIKFTGASNAMYLRMNGSDQMSFYSNDNATEVVSFGNGGGLRLQAGDASINTGVLKMGVTTVIDSSRNIEAVNVQATGGINLRRDLGPSTGISFYINTYYNWQVYMAAAGATSCGANGNLTAPTGLAGVSSWALRSRIESVATYGWIWETGASGAGGATATAKMSLQATTGNLQIAGSFTAGANITAYSDERLKDNIKTLDGSKVLEMRGVSFTKDGKAGSGVIAQELERTAPELVEDDGTYKSVAYGNLVGYLIEAIKDQQKEIDELKLLVKQLLEK